MTRRDRMLLAALVAFRLALSGLALLDDPGRFRQWEESYNATIGHLLWVTGRWDQLLPLQYKSFCGGCTVNSLLAAPLLGLGGDHFLLWKLVPMGWTVATHLLGFLALDRLVNRPAAWAWALLFALPMPGLAYLDLMGWGNHAESAVLVLLALCLRDRPLALGLVVGASVWFCRTTLYSAAVLAPLALLRPDRLRFLVGLGLGLALLLLPAAQGDQGAYQLELRHHLLPKGLPGALDRLAGLVEPDALGRRAFLWRTQPAGFAVAWLVAAGLAALALFRHRVLLALPLSFAAAYAVSGFPVYIVTTASAPNNARYHGPWLFLLTLVVAGGVGSLWPRFRVLGALLLAVPLVTDGLAWTHRSWSIDGTAFHLRGTDYAHTMLDMSSRLPEDVLRLETGDLRVNGALRRVHGQRIGALGLTEADHAMVGLDADMDFGIGQGAVAAGMIDPPEATRFGAGYEQGIRAPRVPAHRRPAPPDPAEVAARFASLGPRGRAFRSSLGPDLAESCSAHMDRCAAAIALTDAVVARSTAIALSRPESDLSRVRALAADLPEPLSAAFLAGVDDPWAGLDQPLEERRLFDSGPR